MAAVKVRVSTLPVSIVFITSLTMRAFRIFQAVPGRKWSGPFTTRSKGGGLEINVSKTDYNVKKYTEYDVF